ncbi:MAG: OsmC family protein [Elusimicrobia bacterium]|nr:OsmC family protein [Elusimicrobiota bacterium]
MNAEELKRVQAPLKDRYRADPASGVVTLRATGRVGQPSLTCKLETGKGLVEAGLHPATGGTGAAACSGDMLLEALVACAGVTLAAVSTAMGITLRGGGVSAEGDLDFRGTLGVDKTAPVGFKAVRLRFDLDTDAAPEQAAKLVELTERYCVVYQTLKNPPPVRTESSLVRAGTI